MIVFEGIIYNNQMDDFSQPGLSNYYGYAPSPANFIKPCQLPIFSKTLNIEILF
jgi:gamma-glutamyltranspeptidase